MIFIDIVDFATNKEFSWASYSISLGNNEVKRIKKFLRNNKDATVRLYHGTSSKHDIYGQGLKPTSINRRNSYVSTGGYVNLSVFPTCAKTFGEIAYPKMDIPVKFLKPDKDQLRLKRLWGNFSIQQIGDSLAESFLFGHGARVKGKIEPWRITKFMELKRKAS